MRKAKVSMLPSARNTVLVVDDQSTHLAIFEEILSGLDRHVVVEPIANPLAAERWARRHVADLVLVDYMMPEMNGIELIGRLRALPGYRHVPIVMVTSNEDRDVRYGALDAGATDFLAKPVSVRECLARCRNLLTLRRQYLALEDRGRRERSGRARAEAERDRLEAQLRESQKMEALGTLAGGVAHDFNNILATIIGNLELARQDAGVTRTTLTSLEEIRKASLRAKDLVQQILAFSRRQVLERQVISLAPVMQESIRLMRATLPAGVELASSFDSGAPMVLADATQVQQMLINLCTNAWQAMQDQQRARIIEVRLEAHVNSAVAAAGSDLQPGRYARVTVRDNGPGMDETTRRQIFEPFFTTKPRGHGTGLGLAVVHGIVHGHGAHIAVHSAPGDGASFRIYFPAAGAVAAAAAAACTPKPTPAQGQGRHVLCVDDDESILFMLKRLLERRGYRVSCCTDARAALAAVCAAADQFDLVVTDFNMPAMSGLDLAAALREIRADLPVAISSGYITEELRAEAAAVGARELIYKPDSIDDLCDAVARLANLRCGKGDPAA